MPDLKKVLNNLDKKLSYTEGHSIAIFVGLDLHQQTGSGNARVKPTLPMTSFVRMDVLSMSKTVTAAGIVHALLSKGLTPKEKIGPHLPKWWNVNAKVASLTFAHVLTHTGGLSGDQADFGQVQALCEVPPAGMIGGVPQYANINYCLLRVLLAYVSAGPILDFVGAVPALRPMLTFLTPMQYTIYILSNILGPSGVPNAVIGPQTPTSGNEAEWFNDNKDDLGDQHIVGDMILRCGADGWFMSVLDYARFIANLTGGQLSPDPWPMMRDTRAPGAPSDLPAYPVGDARLGVWRFQAPDRTGDYYGHNGEWRDAFTGWMRFPDASSIAFFANSPLGPEEQEKMILDSWLAG